MNLGGNLDVNLGGKTHNFATYLLEIFCVLFQCIYWATVVSAITTKCFVVL